MRLISPALLSLLLALPCLAGTEVIPLQGNAYFIRPGPGGDLHHWSDPKSVISVFFHLDQPATLTLALHGKAESGARVRATLAGRSIEKDLSGDLEKGVSLGKFEITKAGYVRLDLQGLSKSGETFADLDALNVETTAGHLSYVRDNEGNRFYWGRRGPSVHLGYAMPEGVTAEYFYNQVTVPAGSDPVGSYFMANGFGEGYFGMQVNSDTERWILFSVWSPYSTDHPGEIPEDQKVVLLKKGEGVHGGEFGGEGAGGQSYWNYPWKAGDTYRFLNRVHPDGHGATIYTAWFWLPETSTWKLIASFKRPHTDKYLTGAHSFLENFSDVRGYLGRTATYSNQWACDKDGTWHELLKAHFTGDDIAQRGWRLDYAGGSREGGFFLRNGGFFNDRVALDANFTRPSTEDKKPLIDFSKLEGN